MAQSSVQPDISYYPDFAKYQARTERRLQSETIDKTLPAGFPQKLKSSLVWEGQDFKHTEEGKEDWIYRLNHEQLDEIDVALAYFKGSNYVSFTSLLYSTNLYRYYVEFCKANYLTPRSFEDAARIYQTLYVPFAHSSFDSTLFLP